MTHYVHEPNHQQSPCVHTSRNNTICISMSRYCFPYGPQEDQVCLTCMTCSICPAMLFTSRCLHAPTAPLLPYQFCLQELMYFAVMHTDKHIGSACTTLSLGKSTGTCIKPRCQDAYLCSSHSKKHKTMHQAYMSTCTCWFPTQHTGCWCGCCSVPDLPTKAAQCRMIPAHSCRSSRSV